MEKLCIRFSTFRVILFLLKCANGSDLEKFFIPTQQHFISQQYQSLFKTPAFSLGVQSPSLSGSAASALASAFSFLSQPLGSPNQFFGGPQNLEGSNTNPVLPVGSWFSSNPSTFNSGWGDGHQPRPFEWTPPTLLKPSDTGWDTSYNVPCGSYRIRPFVIANLRLASVSSPLYGASRSRRDSQSESLFGGRVEDVEHSQKSLWPYFPPVREPRTCSWNFHSDGPCKLKFKCIWFQLPALFTCAENFLQVSDSTPNLNNTFCGNRKPRKVYNSSSGKLLLTFRSQSSSLPAVFDCAVTCSLESSNGPGDSSPSPSIKVIPLTVVENGNNSTSTRNSSTNEKPRMRIGDCKCGVQNDRSSSRLRIVGGDVSGPVEFPWVAALVRKPSTSSLAISNRPFCGGSLISDRYVITAAHCVNNKIIREPRSVPGSNNPRGPKDLFDVLLFEHDINRLDEVPGGSIRVPVDKVIIHPHYDNVTFDYDVALIKLQKPIDFVSELSNYQYSDFLSGRRRAKQFFSDIDTHYVPSRPVPICLPSENDASLEDNYAIITGWGLQTEGGIPSDELLKASVQIFNDTTCKELYREYNYPVTQSMMCAGYLKGKIDSCVGDSGGGMIIQKGKRFNLAGITSWGRGCGRERQPGVYTRVKGMINWIRAEASDGVWCV